MSGKIIARATALTLTALLAACGGDSGSSSLADTGTSSSSGGTTSTNAGDTTQEVTVGLGTGSGDSFVEGQIESDITSLAAGGQTKLRVYVVNKSDGNSLITGSDSEVRFSSTCISLNTAIINSPITTSDGIAETTYTAAGCSPTDLIEATYGSATASVKLNIAAPSADRIVSVPLTTNSIAPSGSGSTSRPSEARVTFNVVDQNGDGVKGVDVSFSLSGDDPNATTPVTLGTNKAVSSTGGEVSTLVVAGSSSTVVRVIASIETDSGTRNTESQPIAINSLIPVDTGFTISADNFIPDAQFTAGVPVSLSVYATDKNGQNIRGNTIVNFTTDGGSVIPECTLDDQGTCTVQWRSQAPWLTKPTITASTIGEKKSTGEVATISQNLTLFVSSSRDPIVSLNPGSEANQYCANASVAAQDGSRIYPADGTTISFSGDGVTILSAKSTLEIKGANGTPSNESAFQGCIFAKQEVSGTPGSLNVTVTTPGGEIAEDIIDI
jgi:hypothetical protein